MRGGGGRGWKSLSPLSSPSPSVVFVAGGVGERYQTTSSENIDNLSSVVRAPREAALRQRKYD